MVLKVLSIDLPNEIFLCVLKYLDGQDLINASHTCTAWKDFIDYHFVIKGKKCFLKFNFEIKKVCKEYLSCSQKQNKKNLAIFDTYLWWQ